ncbi:hypothetical protein ACWGKU_05805 [Kitasatospora sp. NPDC054768]
MTDHWPLYMLAPMKVPTPGSGLAAMSASGTHPRETTLGDAEQMAPVVSACQINSGP